MSYVCDYSIRTSSCQAFNGVFNNNGVGLGEDDEAPEEAEEGEGGEEEELDDDPVCGISGASGDEHDELAQLPAPPPPVALPAVLAMEDGAGDMANVEDNANVAPEQPPPPVPPVPALAEARVRMPALARRQQPNRRHGQHPKSFEFGVFFVKFRDDQSILYPERIPSWTVACPVHEGNCSLFASNLKL